MSGLRQFSDGRRLERSGFAQTCNLLSRYIKEKGSLRDLNIEIGGKVESLEAIVKPGSSHCASASRASDLWTDKGKAVAPISSINTVEDSSYKSISKEATPTDSKPAQLTIFYSGRVLVFDDYPADKAKELVAFANQQSSQMSCGTLSNTFGAPSCPVASTSSPREGLPPRPALRLVPVLRRPLAFHRTLGRSKCSLHNLRLLVLICRSQEDHSFIGFLRRGKIGLLLGGLIIKFQNNHPLLARQMHSLSLDYKL